jgi:hypothetical protein
MFELLCKVLLLDALAASTALSHAFSFRPPRASITITMRAAEHDLTTTNNQYERDEIADAV